MSKNATDLIKEAARDPTLDALLARDPATYTPDDRLALVEHFRRERVLYEIKEQRRKDRKEGQDA